MVTRWLGSFNLEIGDFVLIKSENEEHGLIYVCQEGDIYKFLHPDRGEFPWTFDGDEVEVVAVGRPAYPLAGFLNEFPKEWNHETKWPIHLHLPVEMVKPNMDLFYENRVAELERQIKELQQRIEINKKYIGRE